MELVEIMVRMLIKYFDKNDNLNLIIFYSEHLLRDQQGAFMQNAKSLPQLYPPSEFMNPYRYLHGPHSSSMGALPHPHHLSGPMDLKSTNSQINSFTSGRIPTTSSNALTISTATPTTPSTSMMTPSNGFPQSLPPHLPYIPKHWIWNRNIFYSPLTGRNGELNSKSDGKVSISDTRGNAAELGLEQKPAARCASALQRTQ